MADQHTKKAAGICGAEFPNRPHVCKLPPAKHDTHECGCGVRWVEPESPGIADLERKLAAARAAKGWR